ncbi:MAG TPA: pilus assembly protein N-terminal domain-containing protein [Burkholderiales bacterium]|nr:pilus assembly protein N-terminal domain-containing protein [Burkholderiales bacterium]
MKGIVVSITAWLFLAVAMPLSASDTSSAVPATAASPAVAAVPAATDTAADSNGSSNNQLNMYAGEVQTLPIQNVTRVAVGNGKLLTVSVLPAELVLVAENVGDTSLLVWVGAKKLLRMTIHIHNADIVEISKQLAALLKDFPGISVGRVGDNVVIAGNASKEDMARIDQVAKLYRQTVNMVRLEEVGAKKMVYMKVQVVEMKKSLSETLGIQWQTSIPGPAGAFAGDVISNSMFRVNPSDTNLQQNVFVNGLPSRVTPPRAYLGVATAITSTINLAVNNGDAFVLASPELSTSSGGEAKFLAGGQVPYVVPASGLSPATVSFKDYGVKLSIKPVADDNGRVQADISTEVSSIDQSTAVNGVPGFLTRSTDSEINVQSGQTIVMSGLIDNETAKSVNKLPFLGDLPILGALFRSTGFQSGRTDLIIFVTPTIADPNSTLNQQRLERAQEMREKFENGLGKQGIVD